MAADAGMAPEARGYTSAGRAVAESAGRVSLGAATPGARPAPTHRPGYPAAALPLLLLLALCLLLLACALPGTSRFAKTTPTASTSPLLANVPYECAQSYERHELAKPYQTSGGAKRYTLSEAEWADYFALMGIESLCLPDGLGAPFVNADWQGAESGGAGWMVSIGFESLYHGSGWSDAYVVYSTYDFRAGTEYDRFASVEDYEAVQSGTLSDTVAIGGATAFVRFEGSALCLGRCSLHKSVVFAFADYYVAVVSNVGEYEADAGWEALVPPLRAGIYPQECQGYVQMMDWLARSLRFHPGA